MKYTLSKQNAKRGRRSNSLETRIQLGLRFKYLCSDAGMKVPQVAQALQVTERTVYAWFSGKTRVPYAAYRLLRVINRFELPGVGWEGWHMHSGRLWSPEGHGFTPTDSSHWSLLCRKANTWGEMYDRLCELEDWVRAYARSEAEDRGPGPAEASEAPLPGPGNASASAGTADRAVGPGRNLFHKHFPTEGVKNGASTEGKWGRRRPVDPPPLSMVETLISRVKVEVQP